MATPAHPEEDGCGCGDGFDSEDAYQRALRGRAAEAYDVAAKFNNDLQGRTLQYAPNQFDAGQVARVYQSDPWTILLGDEAFADERTLGGTIVHELDHALSFANGGDAPEETAREAQYGFERWYDEQFGC